MTATSPIDEVLSKLHDVRQQGENWEARCPSHEDRTASLSIGRGKDGRCLLRCHAGCSTTDIVAALNLKMSDLFVPDPHFKSNGKAKSNGSSRIVATHDYHDGNGNVVMQVVRYSDKQFRQRRPDGKGGWEWKVKGCKVVPYHLPKWLENSGTIYVVEGEKDVENLESIGLDATCNAGGAGKWIQQHSTFLMGRDVVVLPDNDDAGRAHAQGVARSVHGIANSVRIVELPGLPAKGDVSDWIENHGDAAEPETIVENLERAVEATPCWEPAEPPDDSPEVDADVDVDGGEPAKKSQATLLVELVEDVELFHDSAGEAYARYEVDDHFEVSKIKAGAFKKYLQRRFFLAHDKAASAQAINDAKGVIEGKALYDGQEHEVHVRVAGHDGKVFIDLCNNKWQVVEVDADGWRILDTSPVMFRRAKAMLPLPMPVEGGDITQLWHFLNVNLEDRPLVVAWLVAALRPVGPYPALAVHGEQGSAKSTGCRILLELIDPNTAPLRSEPREPRDLMIAANNGQVVALDNLSRVSPWLSDCLCRLATGGGFSIRTLYENDEETIITSQRPAILNGIEDLATRSDLLDRCLLVNLPRIEQVQRRPEAELQRDFDVAKPGIFGALLAAVSTAIRRHPTTKLSELPRMADFALWATAAESALGLQDGEFIAAYLDNRASGNETAIEASPIGKAVVDFITTAEPWEGTATELLAGLEKVVDERTAKSRSWPKSARSLSGHLKRIAPNLRQANIGVEIGRTKRGSSIALTRTRTSTESCVTSVTSVTDSENTGDFW